MGTIKDKNSKDLTEAEEIKKRWQEYTEELYKKRSSWPRYSWWCDHSPRARHPGVQSQVGLRKHHHEQSEGYGNPAELFRILKDDAVRVLHSICQQIWKTQQWPQDWKRWVFIPIPKKRKSVSFHFFSIYLPWSNGTRYHELKSFKYWVLSQLSHSPLSPSSRGCVIPFHFLPLEWYYVHIWGCWYFSWQSWFQLGTHPVQHFTWCTLHRS